MVRFRLLATACVLSAATAAVFGQSGAKALFYDPSTGSAVPSTQQAAADTPAPVKKAPTMAAAKFVGIHYWIELDKTGRVSDAYSFHTGDRIRVHVRSNVDGFLSLWSIEKNGEGKMLLPQQATEAMVKADTDYMTPGYIKFVEPVQDEHLLVFFSRSKSELPGTATTATKKTEDVTASTGATGAKSLVFETDDKDPGEIGTYVVNRDGGPVAKEVTLHHSK